jgi:hypothetical protein
VTEGNPGEPFGEDRRSLVTQMWRLGTWEQATIGGLVPCS